MSDKLKVAVDMDDVLVAFTDGIMDTVNRDYGATLSVDDVESWYFGRYGLDATLGEDWWTWMRRNVWLWAEKFKPVPGAIGGITKLRQAGHWVEIVTSKPEWAEFVVWSWLGRYHVAPNQVTIIDATQTATGQPLGKHEVSDADILIDDREENVTAWVASADDRLGLVYTRPWNVNMEMGERMVRVSNWDGILDTITLMEVEL